MKRVCFWFLIFLPSISFAQSGAVAYRLAIVPFYSPFNADYGTYMADRIGLELYRRAYAPALGRGRFVFIETDTLDAQTHVEIGKIPKRVPPALLESLREKIPAAYLLTGSVASTGIQFIRLWLIDLQTGDIVWNGEVRDNPSWVWTRAHRSVGEIPASEVRSLLGFSDAETPEPAPDAENLPKNILFQPLNTTGYVALAADCEMRVRKTIERDGLFSLIPGTLKGDQDRLRYSRIGPELRRQAIETTIADGILTGSLLTLGKDGSTDNMGVVLRLIDPETGRVLWMGSSSGRRVWRWDKMADIIAGMMGRLAEDMAQFGAGAAETQISGLRENAKDGKSWNALGHAYFDRGLLRQAGEAFDEALTFSDAPAQAHAGKGLVLLRRGESFDEGVFALRAALRVDPDYLDAYAFLAHAFLERDMVDGVEIAQEAIRRDPTFAPPYRVLGDWYSERENDPKARPFYETYLRLEPDDVDVAVRLGRSLLRLKDYPGVDRYIAPIVRAKPEASKLLPVVAIKSLWVKRYDEATQFFGRFLAQIDPRERQLYDNVQALLPEKRKLIYNALSGPEKKAFETRFWREKDPDLSRPHNERLLVHYERVWISRWEFGQENYPWDQRGEVYLRYGEPDYRTRSGWIPTLPSTRVQEVKEKVYRELYRDPPDAELIGPVFPIRSDRGFSAVQEREAAVLDVPVNTFDQDGLSNEEARGTFNSDFSQEAYAPVTLQHDRSIVPWESWVYTEVNGGIVVDFTRELGGVSGFDFAPIPSIPPTVLRGGIRLAEHAPEIAFENAVVAQPDEFRKAQILPLDTFYYDVSDSRGGTGKSRVDVAYSVPLASLLVVTDDQSSQVVLERSIALADSAYAVVYRQNQKIQLKVDTSGVSTSEVVDLMRQDVPSGFYHLTVTVTDVMTGRRGVLARDIVIEAYDDQQLQMSDIMLVKSISDTVRDIRFRRGNWQAVPNPRRAFQAPSSLAFYCEVYNLTKDEFGQTRYRVTTAVKAIEEGQRRLPENIEQPEVALSYEQVGNNSWERLPLEVDLANAQVGNNRIYVLIEDLVTGAKVAKETFFDYIR